RSGAYGFPGVRVDGNDVLEVYQAMRHAVARARSGKGPTLLEAVTYRWGDHSMRANLPGYRTKDEELEWQRRDPLARFEMRLIDEKLVAADRLKQIRNEGEHELEEAVAFGVASAEPIVELQIFDFVAMTMDQIVNQAAKFRYMLGGTPTVPLVIRGPQGGGIRLAAQHSQSLEAWFIHVPGLVVVAPSTAADAKGLLTSAIRD